MFSWDKVLNFEGETGPYVQYTHARACQHTQEWQAMMQLQRARTGRISMRSISLRISAHEADVADLRACPEVIVEAGEKYEPSIVTRHIVDICAGIQQVSTMMNTSWWTMKMRRSAKTSAGAGCERLQLKNGLGLLRNEGA